MQAAGELDQLRGRLTVDQAIDDGTRCFAVDVGDQPAELDAGIVEQLVHPILFGRQLVADLLPVTGH